MDRIMKYIEFSESPGFAAQPGKGREGKGRDLPCSYFADIVRLPLTSNVKVQCCLHIFANEATLASA